MSDMRVANPYRRALFVITQHEDFKEPREFDHVKATIVVQVVYAPHTVHILLCHV